MLCYCKISHMFKVLNICYFRLTGIFNTLLNTAELNARKVVAEYFGMIYGPLKYFIFCGIFIISICLVTICRQARHIILYS